ITRIDACEAHCIDPMFFHDTSRILLCMHAATPPISVMNSRRFMGFPQGRGSRIKYSRSGPCIAAKAARTCPVCVKVGDRAMSASMSGLLESGHDRATYESKD